MNHLSDTDRKYRQRKVVGRFVLTDVMFPTFVGLLPHFCGGEVPKKSEICLEVFTTHQNHQNLIKEVKNSYFTLNHP